MCRCSSVGTVTVLGAGLSEVRIPPVERSFSLPRNVHSGSGVHAASQAMETEAHLWGLSRRGVTFNTHLYSADVRNGWSYKFNPALCLRGLGFILITVLVSGDLSTVCVSSVIVQGDSVAGVPKLLSIKNYVIEIMT